MRTRSDTYTCFLRSQFPKLNHQKKSLVSFLLAPMAVTAELINWLGIVLVLGNKLPLNSN